MCKSRTVVSLGKNANFTENLVLKAPQFHEMFICSKFAGGASSSHCSLNDCFVESQFNVNAKSLILLE
jgi:hypothetical protein